MNKTLTQSLLDGDYKQIKDSVLKVAENKIRQKIEDCKSDIIKQINSSN